MKKVITLICFLIISAGLLQAQHEPILKYQKKMRKIEKKLLKKQSDKEAVSYIKATKQAWKKASLYVAVQDGYAQAAGDKLTLQAFKEQLFTQDSHFREMQNTYEKAMAEKEQYIASIDENYKSALDKIYQILHPEEAEKTLEAENLTTKNN